MGCGSVWGVVCSRPGSTGIFVAAGSLQHTTSKPSADGCLPWLPLCISCVHPSAIAVIAHHSIYAISPAAARSTILKKTDDVKYLEFRRDLESAIDAPDHRPRFYSTHAGLYPGYHLLYACNNGAVQLGQVMGAWQLLQGG